MCSLKGVGNSQGERRSSNVWPSELHAQQTTKQERVLSPVSGTPTHHKASGP